MNELYTTILERQQELGDVYFMSCLRSAEGTHNEVTFHGGKTVVKIMLVASLMQPSDMFAADIKAQDSMQKEIPELSIGFGPQRPNGGKSNVIQEGSVSLEVNASPSYRNRGRKAVQVEQESLERAEREQLIMQSLRKNKSEIQPSYMARWTMRRANRALSQLPFTDAILQYVGFDDVWHYNLYFDNDLEMSVSVYVDDGASDSVDFSVYHHGELVVANVLPMRSLVKKMKSVLSKSASNVQVVSM